MGIDISASCLNYVLSIRQHYKDLTYAFVLSIHSLVQLLLVNQDEALTYVLTRKLECRVKKDGMGSVVWSIVKMLLNKFKQNGGGTEDAFIRQTIEPFFEVMFNNIPNTTFLWTRGKLEPDCFPPFSSAAAAPTTSSSSTTTNNKRTRPTATDATSPPLSDMSTLQPDYLLKGIYGIKVDILAVEFKKPDAMVSQFLDDDNSKWGNELKLMVDKLVRLGVYDPVVCGILQIGREIVLVKCYIESEGVYPLVDIAKFGLLQFDTDLNLVPQIVNFMCQLKAIITETLDKVDCVLNWGSMSGPVKPKFIPLDWLRPSFGYPTRTNATKRIRL